MSATITVQQTGTASIDSFRPLLEPGSWSDVEATMRELAAAMRGRTLWNVNSTGRGGGVVELLSSLIPYERGCGVDERWVVIDGSPEFFDVTKRIHNLLHGVATSDVGLSEDDVRVYDQTLERNAMELREMVHEGDVVIAHDPQVAGLVPELARRGVHVIWRCHVGVDQPNDAARSAWRMLTPYVSEAQATVFSRREYEWEGLDERRVHVIPPTIDPFTAKNRDIGADEVASVLVGAGIMRSGASDGGGRRFSRQASIEGEPFAPEARVVMQVSRWDRLKDPEGLLDAFTAGVAPRTDAVLVLAGPTVSSVDDDPEQPEVLNALVSCLRSLPDRLRSRVLIAQLPMGDVDDNAMMVNALQRRADVVVQKSVAEGFGLTVTEALWKGRPVVASRVGGISDQIQDGVSGLLVDDPHDLAGFARAIGDLLREPERAASLGCAARRHAIDRLLTPRHLVEQARLVLEVLA